MIRTANKDDIELIVDLHIEILSWSVNGRLGRTHIQRLYNSLFEGDDFFAVVAIDANKDKLFGFATGTTNAKAARERIHSIFDLRSLLKVLQYSITSLHDVLDLAETALIIPRIQRKITTNAELLTWVSTSQMPIGAIAGRKCFDAALVEFGERGVKSCFAQVLNKNQPPNKFHKSRGTKLIHKLLINNIYEIQCTIGTTRSKNSKTSEMD